MKITKAISLISSGIDSPVATDMIKKKGIDVIGLHCSNECLVGPDSRKLTIELCKKLGFSKLYIINFGEIIQSELKKIPFNNLVCVLCKRFMVTFANTIAEKENCQVIVTGENIGQVASQTLENMNQITSISKLPILRPILCNDKQETIDYAKEIGIYSLQEQNPCSCNIAPKSPSTKASPYALVEMEKYLDFDALTKKALDSVEIINLNQ